jgi:hypothetical protein
MTSLCIGGGCFAASFGKPKMLVLRNSGRQVVSPGAEGVLAEGSSASRSVPSSLYSR